MHSGSQPLVRQRKQNVAGEEALDAAMDATAAQEASQESVTVTEDKASAGAVPFASWQL